MMFKKWQFTLTVAFIALGLLLSLQFRTFRAYRNDLGSQSTETLSALARNLNSQYYELMQEVWDLRAQQKLIEKNASQDKDVAATMGMEMAKLNIANGYVPVTGPGLTVTIPNESNGALYYTDIIDIVNELWSAGAEAVAVNNIRINSFTPILPDEDLTSVTVNHRKLAFPIVISAIGEPDTLDKGISITKGVIYTLRLDKKIPLEIEQQEKITLPAAPRHQFRYTEKVIK